MLSDEEKHVIINKYHTDKNYDLWDAFDEVERAVLAKASKVQSVFDASRAKLADTFGKCPCGHDCKASQQVQDEPVQDAHINTLKMIADGSVMTGDFSHIETVEAYQKLARETLKAMPTPKQDPALTNDTLYNGVSAGRVKGGLEITLFIDSEEDFDPRKVCIGDYGIESLLRTFKFYGYSLNPAPAQAAAIPENFIEAIDHIIDLLEYVPDRPIMYPEPTGNTVLRSIKDIAKKLRKLSAEPKPEGE